VLIEDNTIGFVVAKIQFNIDFIRQSFPPLNSLLHNPDAEHSFPSLPTYGKEMVSRFNRRTG